MARVIGDAESVKMGVNVEAVGGDRGERVHRPKLEIPRMIGREISVRRRKKISVAWQ